MSYFYFIVDLSVMKFTYGTNSNLFALIFFAEFNEIYFLLFFSE